MSSIVHIYRRYPTPESCIKKLEAVRWGDKPLCPYCGSEKMSRHKEVLLVWENIPETTYFYLLDGEMAELAISAHNQIINSSDETEAVEKLSERLDGIEKINSENPFNTGEDVTVVVAGFAM